MINLNVQIRTLGSRTVTDGWYMKNRVKMQRLYYIKGGKGFMNNGQGEMIPFEKGKIYIQPYNLEANFTSDPNDPIDHIYFDFLTAPPIISDTQIIYDLPVDHTAIFLLYSAESLCSMLAKRGIIKDFVPPHLLNKDEKFAQVFENILSALIMVLTYERPIPFASDTVIINTLEIIKENYMTHLSVNDLAAMAGFEVHHFIRKFKRIMGITPYAYLRSYRLIKAKELMGNGMSLIAASERVGYDSPSALSRALNRDGLK